MSRAPSNADIMRAVSGVDKKVDRLKLELVGDEFDENSLTRSVRGRLASVEGRLTNVEKRLETPPMEQARRADKNATTALGIGIANRRGVWFSVASSALGLLLLVGRALGMIP